MHVYTGAMFLLTSLLVNSRTAVAALKPISHHHTKKSATAFVSYFTCNKLSQHQFRSPSNQNSVTGPGQNTQPLSHLLQTQPPFSFPSFVTLFSTKSDEDSNDFEPTWTYVPYKPPPPMKKKRNSSTRNFSSSKEWVVPKTFEIPENQVEISFVRSSGAGGQNVNKLSTKVEIRFLLKKATWIPREVRERLAENEATRINKEGYFSLNSQEYRTQVQNRKDVFDKLKAMILKAWPRPKIRKKRKGPTAKEREKKKDQKKRRSDVKKMRGKVDF